MSKEALKLALEAFEDRTSLMKWQMARDAVKEALAQQCVCGEPNSAGTHRTDGPCLALQRTWVGLTDEEIVQCQQGDIYHFYRCIEAKLRSKNNG